MFIQNVSARLHRLNGIKLAPGETTEVSEEQGNALIAATKGKNARPQSGELVQVGPDGVPMPEPRGPQGLKDLPEDTAVQLVGKASTDSLDKLTEGETRPAVLSAALKRKKGF